MAARREVVHELQAHGLSERQALRLVGMSPSTLRYGAAAGAAVPATTGLRTAPL